MTNITTEQTSLQIDRTFDAPRDKVFQAFIDPDIVAKWYHPGPMRTVVHAWEPRPGGALHIAMIADEGEMKGENVSRGTFKEVEEGRKIVHTWKWDDMDADPNESLVTVTFEDADGGTKVTLVHEQLSGKESVESHTQGWVGCLENLATVL